MARMDIAKTIAALGTQAQAARKLGVNIRTIRRWVAGDSKPIGLSLKALKNAAKGHG